jgi:hypothetical protein
VSNGTTLAGSGTQAGGKGDPLYQSGVGDACNRGQVVLQWTEFTVSAGGPPAVELVRGGPAGYPGVRVASSVALAPVTVTVALPADKHLLFGTQNLADYQLTVQQGDGTTTVHMGALSEDGTSLAFSDVNLPLPGSTIMWVAVSAGQDTPLGSTNLTYTVAGERASSTKITVKPAFTLTPGGAPVTLERGGPNRYPGVEVRNQGAQGLPLQKATVTLPEGSGLTFGPPSNPDHQLTVSDGNGGRTVYMGTLSPDGRALAFAGVNLSANEPGTRSVMWVGVSAAGNAPTGPTHAVFTVGDQTSLSTTLNIS